MNNPRTSRHRFLALLVIFGLAASPSLPAIDYFWQGTTDSNFTTVENWRTEITGATAGAVPTGTDIAHFNADGLVNAFTSLGANRALQGISFNSNSATPITIGTLNDFILSLGSSGIDVLSGAGAHTINSALTLTATQTWNNVSADPAPFTIAGNFTTGTNTLNLTGTNGFTVSGATNVNGVTTLNNTGSGTLLLSGPITLGNTLSLNGTGDINLSGTTTLGASRVINVENTGGVSLGNITNSATATVSINAFDTAAPEVNGVISNGTGSTSVTLNNLSGATGTIDFNAANSFTGTLIIVQGQLNVNASNLANTSINLGATNTNGVGQTATLNLAAGTNYRIGTVTQQANSAGGIISGGAGATLSLDTANRTLNIGKTTSTGPDLLIGVGIVNGGTTGRALTKDGTGTVQFDGVNTFTGTFSVRNGTVIQNASQTASGALTMGGIADVTPVLTINNGVTYRLGGTLSQSSTGNGGIINGNGTLGLFSNRTFSIGDAASAPIDLLISTSITDGDATARNITKTGAGTLSMQGANSYSGSTSLFNGTLILDYSFNNTDSRLHDSAALAMQGGRLELQGNDTGPTIETTGTTTINSGSNTIALVDDGHAVDLYLASLTRTALSTTTGIATGVVNFQLSDPTLTTITAAAGTANNANGFLGGWATHNGNRWATKNVDNQIVAYTGITKNDKTTWAANDDIVVTSPPTGILSAPAVSTLILDNNASTTLDLDNNARSLTLTNNALLVGSTAGANDTTLNGSQIIGHLIPSGVTEMIITNQSTGVFTLNANLGSATSLVGNSLSVVYGGPGLIHLTGTNFNLGTTTIHGNVQVSGGNALADYSTLTLGSASSSLSLNNSSETIGTLSSPTTQTASIDLGTSGHLTINQRNDATYNGTFTGGGTITKAGNNRLSLSSSNLSGFTGNVEVLGGNLELNMDTSGFSAISSLLLRGGTALIAQNGSASRDKIANTATIILEGTTANGLRIASNQNGGRTETAGKLELSAGANTITLANTATSPTAAVTTLTFSDATDAFERSNNATLLVRTSISDLGGPSTSLATRVTFASGIADQLIGNGAIDPLTITDTAILPFAIGGISDVNNPGTSFLTIGNNGLRILLDTEYANNYATAASTDNLSLNTTATALATATFNALRLDTTTGIVDLTGAPGSTLTLTSGALLVSGGATANGSTISGFDQILAGGTPDAVPDELIIFTTTSNAAPTAAVTTINSSIANNGAAPTSLTKTGNGTLVLGGTNSYTGTTTINQGRVEFTTDANLGTGGPIRMAGGTLAWTGANTTDISTRGVQLLGPSSFVIPFHGTSGIAVITGNTFDTTGNTVTLTQSIGQNGNGGLVKTGTGTLNLNGGITYTGSTILQQGTLNFSTIAANTTSALHQIGTTGTLSSTIADGLHTGSVIVGGVFGAQSGNLSGNLTVQGGDVNIGSGQDGLLLIAYKDNSASGGFNIKATANFSAADSVTVNVDRIILGSNATSGSASGTDGNLLLSTSGPNHLTASRIHLADSPGPGNNATGDTSSIILGDADNTIHADMILIGGRKARGEITGDTGTFTLRSQDGHGGANVYLADNDVSTGTIANGVLNLNGMQVNAIINTLNLARHHSGAGGANATLSYNLGIIKATTIEMAITDFRGSSTSDGSTDATINHGGTATMQFQTLSKGNGDAVYNWQGGTIQNLANDNLTNQNVTITFNGTGSATDPTLRTFTVDENQTATFQADAEFAGAGSFTKNGEGDLNLLGTNINTGNVHIAQGTLSLEESGSMNDAAWFNIATDATLKVADRTTSSYASDAVISGTGTIDATDGTFTVGSNIGTINTVGSLRPGASSTNHSLASATTVGDLTGSLTIQGNLVLEGDALPLERAVLQLASSNRNASSSLGNYANIAAWVDNIDTDFASFMEGSGGNHDFIDINGDLTLNLNGGITVETLNGYTGVFGDVFNLLDWVDLNNNGFTMGERYRLGTETGLDLVLPTLAASYQWDTSLFATHGVLVVVPEPTRTTLLTAAFAFLLLQRRRKQK